MKGNFTFEIFGLIWVASTFDFCFEHDIFFKTYFIKLIIFSLRLELGW